MLANEQPEMLGVELAGTKSFAWTLLAPPEPPSQVSVMLALPSTVVFDPAPIAAFPITFSFVSPSALA
jgi:hypothetical protein